MNKWISEIPALRKVEALAEKYADQDPELAEALATVKEARQQARDRHKEALEQKGIKCTECDTIFLSTEWNNYTLQCSVGCRLYAIKER